jgi:hypothetical protein
MHVFGDSQKLPRPSYWNTRTLTVGLIAREVEVATRCIDSLQEDCKRFDAMLKKWDNETRTAFSYMTNVLVVAVTGCSDELRKVSGNAQHDGAARGLRTHP